MTDPNQAEAAPLPPIIENPLVTYGGYLHVGPLLDLQQPLSEPEHHDEMLFIIIHQVYELWFKQLLHEADAAVAAFDADRVLVGHKIFRRVTSIQRVLVTQLQVLETMTPQDFGVFRKRLNPASGFQSAQFRELEVLSGLKDPRYLRYHQRDPDSHARLAQRLEEPTIYDAFVACLGRAGFDVPTAAPEADTEDCDRLLQALRRIYEDSDAHYALYLMCEYMIEYDELFQIWRFNHVKMVERTIGIKRGTGGSAGAMYLRSTLSKRFFPELWDVRSLLGGDGQGS